MKKTTIMLVTVLFMIIGYAAYNATVNIYGLGKISENISDFKVYLDNLKVNDKESTGINDVKDEFTIDNVNGKISVDIVNDSTEYDTESYLECASIITPDKTEWTFDYTGSEQTFTVPVSGTYKLETWGAQGGAGNQLENYPGGYGGYSVGLLNLEAGNNLYIYVGSQGSSGCVKTICSGGYNGGASNNYSGSGGSSYIGNTLLTEKLIYCYNCTESSEDATKTISTTCTNETPTENCSKQGNGYARITLISEN